MSFFSIASVGTLAPPQLAALLQLHKIGAEIAVGSRELAAQQRINSAADDAAGLVLASSLQNEIEALGTTADGLTQASSLVGAASGALGQIVIPLNQALALSVAGGTLNAAQVAADQSQFDQVLTSIDTLTAMSFNGVGLFDGNSSYQVQALNNNQFASVQVLDKETASDVAVSVDVTHQATQATNGYSGGTLSGDAIVNVSGPSGTAVVSLGSGATTTDIAAAFNAASHLTGINATRIDANNASFNSVNYGSSAKISLSTLSGTFATTTSGTTAGTDAQATINGQTVIGNGATFSVNAAGTNLEIAVNPLSSGQLQSFTVTGSLESFQRNTLEAASANLAIAQINLTAALDSVDGVDVAATISTLVTSQLLEEATLDSLRIFNPQRQHLLRLLTGLTSRARAHALRR